MKTCPYCAEQIQDAARICPHCRGKFRQCINCGEYVGKWTMNCPGCAKRPPPTSAQVRTGLIVLSGIVISFIAGWVWINHHFLPEGPEEQKGIEKVLSDSDRGNSRGAASSSTVRSSPKGEQPPAQVRNKQPSSQARAEVSSIQTRAGTIRVGDLEDDVIAFLNDIFRGDRPADHVARAVRQDPDMANSLIKTMKFTVDGRTYTLTTRRTESDGRYRLTQILRSTPPLPASPETPNQPSTQSREAPRTHRMEGNFGCRDRAKFEELNGYHVNQNDTAFLGGLVRAYQDGTCRTFDDGEEVYVTERAISSGLVRVRPKGETSSWWTYADAIR